jgi:hypothetical protein
MSEGYLEDDATVECPLHAASFCLKTGKAHACPPPIRSPPTRFMWKAARCLLISRRKPMSDLRDNVFITGGGSGLGPGAGRAFY